MSLYPENPAGQTFISQDTYASANVALSGIGGGGGLSPIPANLAVSSLTVQGEGDGNITLVSNADYGFTTSAPILFNTAGQETLEQGQLQLYKTYVESLGPVSTLYCLQVDAFSTFGQYQPIAAKSIILGGDNNDGTTPGAEIDYSNSTSTISMYAPKVSVPALVGVSSINGVAYSTGGGVPANLEVSTLTVNATNYGNITLTTRPDLSSASAPIVFNTPGQDTEGAGQLQIHKFTGMQSLGPVSTVSGLVVNSFSTVYGQLQPVMSKSIILGGDNNDSGIPGAEIDYTNTTSTLSMYAPKVSVPALIGVSSINATPFFAPRSGIFFMPTGTDTGYYDIPNPPAGITSNAVVMCTLTRPDGASQNWIVNSGVVQGGGGGTNWYIEVVMAALVVDDNTAVAWDLVAPNVSTLGVAGVTPT